MQVLKINTNLNRNKMKYVSFSLYPETEPVPEAPVASLPDGIVILFDWPCLV